MLKLSVWRLYTLNVNSLLASVSGGQQEEEVKKMMMRRKDDRVG